jgi:conjugal transfer pilus assembly protein TraW
MNPPLKRSCAAMLVVVMGVLLAGTAPAKDLGVRGETWAIAEPDLLAVLETRLLELEHSGALAAIEEEARERVRARIEAPEPVAGITPAAEHRTRLVDPSVVLERDVRLPDGTMLAAAGTHLNPLEHAPLGRDLLFIDGRRDTEVSWALTHAAPAKIVLLAGRPLDLSRRHGRPFFFDQDGRLAARFRLAATPVRIEQEGLHLRLTEVPLRDRGGRP